MTISTEFEVRRIMEYANTLRKIYDLQEQISYLRDKLINLACCMTQEDINEANMLFEKGE